MKAKAVASMCLAAVLAGSMLTGCGGAKETKETQKTEANTKSTGVYDHEAIENAGDITLTMMVSGVATENDFDTEVLPKLVKEKWPNVTLEVTKLPDDNYYTSLKTKLASGECPDIILTQPMYAGSNSCYALAEAGYLAPLDDLDYLSNMKDLAAVTYNDHVVTATSGVAILGTYYNKDMFDQAGITDTPSTWEQFLDACDKLQKAGFQPIVMGDKDMYVLQFGLYQLAANEIYPTNAKYDEQLRDGDTKFTDKDTWDKVLSMYKELYDKKYIDASQSLGLGASQAITQFVDGKAAMTFDGSFNAAAIMAQGAGGDFERGYFPLPGTQESVYTATCLSAGYSVYANSKYVDECKEFLDYWLNGKSDVWKAYLSTGRVIPTYGEGADSIPNYDLFKGFIDLMNEGKAFHWCNQAWPAGTETTMEELFSEMVGGQGTKVEDITKGMQDKFEDLLE